jgi:uncharacterized protein (DUF2384 family)
MKEFCFNAHGKNVLALICPRYIDRCTQAHSNGDDRREFLLFSLEATKLECRVKAGRFNPIESDRIVGLIAFFERALSLFENDVTTAAEWMSTFFVGLVRGNLGICL